MAAFQPRSYQKPGPQAIMSGEYRRYCGVLHRRAGKDRTWWNTMIWEAMRHPGVYYYWLPTFAWAKRVIWYGMTEDGHRFLDDIPKQSLAKKGAFNETDLRIQFANDAIIQLVGSDNISSSLVGTNPIGNVFSEYPIGNPDGWNYVRPILAENKGWAAFIYTPRGRNHGYELSEVAKRSPDWFYECKTVGETFRDAPGEDGSPVITPEFVENERRTGMPEELVQQEYYCSFVAFVAGSYFGRHLENLRQKGNVRRVAYDANLLVHTAWDLGIDNATSIWFFQLVGNEVRLLEYYEQSGEGLPYHVSEMKTRPYIYGDHLAPHDIQVRDFSTGVSRWETARNLGITFTPVPRLAKPDQRNAVYSMLNRCYFDEFACEPGLSYLGQYHAKHNEGGYYSTIPVHDETSNAADAFQLLAVGLPMIENVTPPQTRAITDFDPLGMDQKSYDDWRHEQVFV